MSTTKHKKPCEPGRDIRNNIVLVNSLNESNTDGVIMMLDWAKAYDSVDNE